MGLCCCKDDGERAAEDSHLLAGGKDIHKDAAPFDPRSPNVAAGLTRTPYQGAGARRREGAARAPGPSQFGGSRTGAFQPVRSGQHPVAANDPDATGHGKAWSCFT